MKVKLLSIALFGIVLTESLATAAPKPKVLVFRKATKEYDQVYERIEKELKDKVQIDDEIVSKSTTYEDFKETIMSESPGLVVLMDNQPVGFAIKYNSEQKNVAQKIKGVSLMGLHLKYFLKGNKEISGIAFEIPAYSLLTQFRFIVKKPIKNVLVFYRKSLFQETIDAASKQLALEGIKLHAINVETSNKNDEKAIETFLEQNLKKHTLSSEYKYDAVWVMLDSALLKQNLFERTWVPAARGSKVAFLTGTPELASKEMNFGTFAIAPNLSDLASQATQQIESILFDSVSPGDIGVEEIISVEETINLARAKDLGLQLNESSLKEVTKIE